MKFLLSLFVSLFCFSLFPVQEVHAWKQITSTGLIGLSTEAKPTHVTKPDIVKAGTLFFCSDTGLTWVYPQGATAADTVWVLSTPRKLTSTLIPDTLTAAGSFPAKSVKGYSQITIAICDSLLGSTSYAYRLRIKIAGMSPIDWGTADAEYDTTQVTSTGTIYRTFQFAAPIDSAQVQIVTEGGGTDAKWWSVMSLANSTSAPAPSPTK